MFYGSTTRLLFFIWFLECPLLCVNSQSPITLECQTLHNLDGSPIINIVEIIKFKKKIKKILKQKIATVTFKELIALEDSLPPTERSQVLSALIQQFENVTKPYSDDLRKAHAVITLAVQAWLNQRKSKNSALSLINSDEFQNYHEHEALLHAIHSLKDLNRFLEDLHLFLRDFIHSLPKSLKRYHEAKHHHNAVSIDTHGPTT